MLHGGVVYILKTRSPSQKPPSCSFSLIPFNLNFESNSPFNQISHFTHKSTQFYSTLDFGKHHILQCISTHNFHIIIHLQIQQCIFIHYLPCQIPYEFYTLSEYNTNPLLSSSQFYIQNTIQSHNS